ncbi:TPA: AAA family ATPase [Enterobacter asburiae]|nr:AAA family ATPase [Enterobacter asburiae]
MESFTEFDIHSNECLKRLKNIAKDYNEDHTQVIKCFLIFLFAKRYIQINKYRDRIHEVDKLVKLLDFSESSRYINLYSELVGSIRNILRDYSNIKALDDFIRTEEVIREVFQLSRDINNLENEGAFFDFFFNNLFGQKVDDFVSRLIRRFSGRYLKNDFVQEIPLLTGQVAIDGAKGLALQERVEIDLYLGMRLYLHEVVIKRNDDPEVYFVRNIDDIFFKKTDYGFYEDINAFKYFVSIARKKKFHAFILGSARSHGWALVELANLGALRAVIELPRAYNSKARNLYVLDSYGDNLPGVLFISSDKLYSFLRKNDSLFASFISELIALESDRHSVDWTASDNNHINEYIKRFFPDGYNDVSGLVCRASPGELYNNKSMSVSNFVSSSKDEDFIFSPLDYTSIYHEIANGNKVGGHYVIGNNGVGKSLLLRFLAEKLISENLHLLLVSFGFSDRFHQLKNKKGVVYLGDKQSEKNISLIKRNKEILECIQGIFSDEKTHNFFNLIIGKLGFSVNLYCVPTSYATSNNNLFDYSSVYKMEDFIAQAVKIDNYLLAVRHTNNEQIVIFDNLSSGEQQLLFMFSRIISKVVNNNVIIIDEPEVSMHIEWQQKLPHLFDMISEEYHTSFVVATHSPIIINSVDMNKSKCYAASRAGLAVIDKHSVRNVESTILDSFDVVTKNNRSVYETCAKAVSEFMGKVNSNLDVERQYQRSTKGLNELLLKLNENNPHAFTNEISLVRRAQEAVRELYQNYKKNERVG